MTDDLRDLPKSTFDSCASWRNQYAETVVMGDLAALKQWQDFCPGDRIVPTLPPPEEIVVYDPRKPGGKRVAFYWSRGVLSPEHDPALVRWFRAHPGEKPPPHLRLAWGRAIKLYGRKKA